MRNFLLAGNVAAIAASTAIDKAPAGALGFYYMNNGVPTVDATGKLITGYGQIVMGRASKDGGPIIIPFYNKDFSYSKSTYSPAETFTAKFTVPEPVIMCDHTVIFTKKGIQFNERSNWTASIHVFKDTETAEQVAAKIANYVNNNTATLGLTAAVSTALVTVTATEPAVDYEITMADALSGTTVNYASRGKLELLMQKQLRRWLIWLLPTQDLNILIWTMFIIYILIILLVLILEQILRMQAIQFILYDLLFHVMLKLVMN